MVKKELLKKIKSGFMKRNRGKGNVALNAEKFKFIKNLDLFTRELDQLKKEERVFQEVMSEVQKVKPYIKFSLKQVAWPDLNSEAVLQDVVNTYTTVIHDKFQISLTENDFKISKCVENGT